MSRARTFNGELRRDVERRLRVALARLNERVTDLAIESARAGGDDMLARIDEQITLERHMHTLRSAVVGAVVFGLLELRADAEEALRVAQEPRRPARPPAPSKTTAKPAAPARRPPTTPRTYTVNLDVVDATAGAARPSPQPRALQEPLFGRPLMLPQHAGKEES